nr:hypothetical protein [Tanacetum cinerariifolium]
MKQSETKSKGLTVLSEAALSEADQMKVATERTKKEFHIFHVSGLGDGVDILSKVRDEQQQTVSCTNKGTGDKPEVSTPPGYEILDDEEKGNDDDKVSSDQKVMGGEQEDEELYGDLNLNLDRRDAKMTEAQIIQEMNEVHMTLTTELPVVQQQISSISSDLVSKFINPTSDTIIDLILNPNVQSNIPINVSVSVTTKTPSSDTTIPQPHILIIQPQQQTHDSTTTTPILTTSLPKIPNYASLFGFKRRVSSLESELSKLKQTNQFAEAVSSISGIVDNYLGFKIKDAVNVAVQLQSNKLREEAQAKKDEFLKQIDSNIKAIIKD